MCSCRRIGEIEPGTQPAKLYDYFLVRRPILCFSLPSELTSIIEETRTGLSLGLDDTEGAVEAIERAIAARDRPELWPEPDQHAIARFSAPETARKLAEILDDMAG